MSPSPIAHRCPWRWSWQIDRVSDEFESAWKAGKVPHIEDYVERVPAVGRSRLMEELLVMEFELRQKHQVHHSMRTSVPTASDFLIAMRLSTRHWLWRTASTG